MHKSRTSGKTSYFKKDINYIDDDKLLKKLLLIPIFAILTIGFTPLVHGEEVTIEVPFKVFEQTCTLYHDVDSPGIEIFRCWMSNQILEDDYQPALLIPAVQEEPEEEPPAPQLIVVEPELTKEQEQLLDVSNAIEYLKSLANPTPSQIWWQHNLDNNLRHCSYGILAAKAFQQETSFVVSPDWISYVDGVPSFDFPEIPNTKSISLRIGDPGASLYMANETCRGQGNYYDGDISPQHYINFLTNELPEGEVCTYESIRDKKYDCQPHHQNMAGAPGQSKDAMSPRGDQQTEEEKAFEKMCSSPNLTTAFQKQMGCIIHYDHDEFIGTSSNQITKLGNSPMIKTEWYARTCGLIDWSEIANDRYMEFLDEMASLYSCNAWPRIEAIMLFDPILEHDSVHIENSMNEIRDLQEKFDTSGQ